MEVETPKSTLSQIDVRRRVDGELAFTNRFNVDMERKRVSADS